MSDRRQVTVNIYGRSYTMLTDEPEGQTERIAAALNERMKRLRAQKSSLSLQDAAAIISLECMEQLVNTKQAEQNIRTQISAYAEEAELSRGESDKLRKEIERLKERVRQLEQERKLRESFAADESNAAQMLSAGITRALGAPPKQQAPNVQAQNTHAQTQAQAQNAHAQAQAQAQQPVQQQNNKNGGKK